MGKWTLVVLWAALSAFAGCAGSPDVGREDARITGERAVTRILAAYTDFQRERFEALVSEDFRPSRQEFLHAVEDRARAERVLELLPTLGRTAVTGEQMAIEFKWRKSAVPESSASPVKTQGAAEFLFRREAPRWRLLEIRGASPL